SHNFAPLSDADWPEEISDMLSGFAGGLNVYRTMAHHPQLLRSWATLREHVVNQTTLGAEFREVVILRTGTRLGSTYEWQQHILRARKAGLSDHRIARLKGPLDQIEGKDRPLAAAVDEIFETNRLTSSTQADVMSLVGKKGLLDLMATVGFYSTLGFILNSFDTPLDDDIASALQAEPLVT
uniref:carboxymuconolactone decarboxylase family protein n=1 Tax=Cognatishimia sp. TaxID=2211648 RepID=UPI00351983EC